MDYRNIIGRVRPHQPLRMGFDLRWRAPPGIRQFPTLLLLCYFSRSTKLPNTLCTQKLPAPTHHIPHTPPRSRAGQAGLVEKRRPCSCRKHSLPILPSLPHGCRAAAEQQQQRRQQPTESLSFSRATRGCHRPQLTSRSRALVLLCVCVSDADSAARIVWRRALLCLKPSRPRK